MKNLKVLIILLLLIQCTVFSQKIISNKKDTLIGYTLTQNDFIIKELRQGKYYKQTSIICESQNLNNIEIIKFKNLVIKTDSLDKLDLKKIIKNKDEFLFLKDNELIYLKETLNTVNTKLKFQKVYKWTAIIIGSIITGLIEYKYLIK
jgi:hypothetical protein